MKRLLAFAALIAWSGMAAAVVYKWTDGQGKLQYGDRPPDGVHAQVVELLGGNGHGGRSVPAPTATRTASPSPSLSSGNPQPASDDATKKAVADDVAQSREKQCVDAQARYKKLIEGRRIYKPGPNGERQYLSSEEIDTERLDAKREVEAVCNASGT